MFFRLFLENQIIVSKYVYFTLRISFTQGLRFHSKKFKVQYQKSKIVFKTQNINVINIYQY